MYQFFVNPDSISDNRIMITGPDVNHIKNVLRMKPGEEIAVSNGQDAKEYRCGILTIDDDAIVCELRFIKESDLELPARIHLFQALPKSDKMELIVQKAVELGAYEIIPVNTKRCIMKLDEKKEKNKLARWQGISEAAAKQSKRKIIPQVREVMTFERAIQYAKDMEICIIPYELARGMDNTVQVMNRLAKDQDIAVFIGPEGGFDEAEIALATEAGIIPISLGKRILRTETAGLAVLSMMMYQLEIRGLE